MNRFVKVSKFLRQVANVFQPSGALDFLHFNDEAISEKLLGCDHIASES